MIEATQSTAFAATGGFGHPARRAYGLTLALAVQATPTPRRAAPPLRPRPCAASLQCLLTDGAPLRLPDLARVAARAFSAGDGFLPGQMIDRAI
jgi:hypothetical protein